MQSTALAQRNATSVKYSPKHAWNSIYSKVKTLKQR